LITSGTPPDLIYRAWRKKAFELITSEWQLEELRLVSRYPKLPNYLKPAEAGALVNGLRCRATVLQERPKVEFSPDPDCVGFGEKRLTLVAIAQGESALLGDGAVTREVRKIAQDLADQPFQVDCPAGIELADGVVLEAQQGRKCRDRGAGCRAVISV
jgi:hypothetical protein